LSPEDEAPGRSYGAGLGKFSAKFKPSQPYSATVAIEKGDHGNHGTAIFFEQGVYRCLVAKTLFGLTDDEALWFTMSTWAKFQPRRAKPRQDPGLLFYPAQYSHVFEKYWDCLHDPLQHPDCNESDHTRSYTQEMASALASMTLESWEPQVDAEANEKSCRVAHFGALSRRCPIHDAADYWLPGHAQESSVTDSGGPPPVQDRYNVDT
jgi:hypothetical protein